MNHRQGASLGGDETIAAIATPLGEGGLGIVRLSGARAHAIAQRLFRPRVRAHRQVVHGWVVNPETQEGVDEALVTLWQAPRSYTGEDVAELSCHGSPLVLRTVLSLCLSEGARLAEPGEFTKRAFLNGRMDLAEAEAVADLIRAKTDAALKASLRQLEGKLSEEITRLRDDVVHVLGHVEAGIDFVEEDITFITPAELERQCQAIIQKVDRLLATARQGKLLRHGVAVAIVGKPNVGKSSLLNALLREDRAIVTPVPGTTRDVIEEYVNFEGLPVRLIDTAGIRETHEMVEQLGVERSRRALDQADIVLWVVDGSTALDKEDEAVVSGLPRRNGAVMGVVNKLDLPQIVDLDRVEALSGHPVVPISAKTGEGLERLVSSLVEHALGGTALSNEVVITNERHAHALQEARASLARAIEASKEGLSEECASADLRGALDRLGEIVGIVTTEDVLGHIFSTFCIGK